MTETVQTALITCVSGVAGALCGLLGGVIAAKINARSVVEKTVIQEQFKTRLQFYQNIFAAHTAMAEAKYSVESYGAFLKAINAACLVSSATTAVQLLLWQDMVDRDPSSPACNEAMTSALVAMQHDLDNFTAPRVLKNKWPKQQRVQLHTRAPQ